jgi:two-component system, NtrC family, sensor histidine kinase HydH
VPGTRSSWTHYLPIVLATVAISALHYLTPPPVVPWHTIFQRFYYLPIIVAAIQFGWRGGLLTAVVAAVVCYVPHNLMWHQYAGYSTSQYGDIVVFHAVGVVTGVLADSERKKRRELHIRADQLKRAYEELKNTSELLKRADRLSAVGRLSTSLAEEIQGPLATIERSVDAMERPRSQQESVLVFESIKRECRAVIKLLSNLHRLATPRPPSLALVDLGKVIQAVADHVRSSASARGILLRHESAIGLPRVECDAEQLEQVLLALALNSVQAMAHGGEIVMAARRRGAEILIQVKDERGETASEQLEGMFETLGAPAADHPGLGLSIAEQIIEQHKGFIAVERNDGKGATFSVLLPLTRGRAA